MLNLFKVEGRAQTCENCFKMYQKGHNERSELKYENVWMKSKEGLSRIVVNKWEERLIIHNCPYCDHIHCYFSSTYKLLNNTGEWEIMGRHPSHGGDIDFAPAAGMTK